MSFELERDGFAMVRGVFSGEECARMVEALGLIPDAGKRGVLADEGIDEVARSGRVLDLIRDYLPGDAGAVRAIGFDKTPTSNWLVSWHQDLTIAVKERIEVAGFGPWSVKGGIPHVQPPMEVLEQMVTVRIHLDRADEENGALRVLPGTHRFGRILSDTIQIMRSSEAEYLCKAEAGDVLLMRPLLLHASSKSTAKRHRRILHIEYADHGLPGGLEWSAEA